MHSTSRSRHALVYVRLNRNGHLLNAIYNKSPSFRKHTIEKAHATFGRVFSTKINRDVEERKVNVDGVDINYVRVGTGDHPVLLLPGAIGSIWTDFGPQIEGLDRNKLTVIAWDPPGYGKSRPPNRTFFDDFFERDAKYAFNLMKTLGYKKYSLIGWSDGGITSIFLAGTNSNTVRKMILVGANSFFLPEELKIYQSIRNIDTWSEKMKKPLIEVYGEDYFRKTWSGWIDAMERLYEKQKGDICTKLVPHIKCPTLIVHGKKDIMVNEIHPKYLLEHIPNAKLKVFEKGAHNLHLRYHEEFNSLATEFFTEK
ncbi:hypothetical protein KPH14_011929 [Odynerus spinipes]|uniref:AB hydrolase-1 domain-containing protein n=1 Tax=Odynerus spinipes TaxID=1348599 RepID=A0AAD9VKD0_9HYME|nr:hypothetical protein KPH14_011929 [Odynerus spinipes]